MPIFKLIQQKINKNFKGKQTSIILMIINKILRKEMQVKLKLFQCNKIILLLKIGIYFYSFISQ